MEGGRRDGGDGGAARGGEEGEEGRREDNEAFDEDFLGSICGSRHE